MPEFSLRYATVKDSKVRICRSVRRLDDGQIQGDTKGSGSHLREGRRYMTVERAWASRGSGVRSAWLIGFEILPSSILTRGARLISSRCLAR